MTIKWGVIGAGGIASRRTIPEMYATPEHGAVVAIMDPDPQAVARVKDAYAVPCAYTGETELLENPEVEAVYVASPNFAHAQQVIAAAKHGKHVLCEKPLAGTVRQAEQMIEACQQAGVLLGVNFCMRLNPYHQKAKDLVAAGALGRVVTSRAQLTAWYPPISGAWRQDMALGYGGSLIDMGSHCVDLLEHILGAPVVAVSGVRSSRIHAYAPEDTAVGLLEFANGAVGMVDASFAIPDEASRNVLEIYGERGSLIAAGSIGQTPTGQLTAHLRLAADGYQALQDRDRANGVLAESYNLQGPPLYGEMVRLFGEAIRSGRPLVPDGQVGLHNLRVILGIYEASDTGRRVSV